MIEEIERYFDREVLPYVPDARIDHDKTKLGYEISFTREFYVHESARPLNEISAEINSLEEQIQDLLKELPRA